MVGPLGGGKYYCRGKEYGTCDRRSGTCFCEMGYQGIDCGECGPGHFKIGSLCYPKKLCAGDCGGHGTCNYTIGECVCDGGYWGEDCEKLNCKRFDALCDRCSNTTCTTCQVCTLKSMQITRFRGIELLAEWHLALYHLFFTCKSNILLLGSHLFVSSFTRRVTACTREPRPRNASPARASTRAAPPATTTCASVIFSILALFGTLPRIFLLLLRKDFARAFSAFQCVARAFFIPDNWSV